MRRIYYFFTLIVMVGFNPLAVAAHDSLNTVAESVVANSMPLSPVEMFLQADAIVKAVMLGLAGASILTWTFALAKFIFVKQAIRRVKRLTARVQAAQSWLDVGASFEGSTHLCETLLKPIDQEFKFSVGFFEKAGAQGLKERVASSLLRSIARLSSEMAAGLGFLATVGSVGPFIGLFGTVWGIMNSFVNIAAQQTGSLAVVAPGIAEALLATSIGLVAAIPAVIFYNVLSRLLNKYRQNLHDLGAAIERLISREYDSYQTNH